MLIGAARARVPRPVRSPLRVPARTASFRATSRLTGPLAPLASVVRVVGTASMADEAVADVRFDDGDPAAGLTIEVPLPPPLGVKLLQRPADEPLGKALGRLRATVEKARKGKGSKRPPADAPAPAPPPSRTPASRTLAATAKSSPRTFPTHSPGATVSSSSWTASGVSESASTRPRWRRRQSPAKRPSVARSSPSPAAFDSAPRTTSTGDGSEGRVKPPSRSLAGARTSPRRRTSARRSWRRRGRTPRRAIPSRVAPREVRRDRPGGDPRAASARARARAEALGSRDGSSSTVRVMTYNALADAYSHTWGALYPYLDPAHAAAERRLALAMEDVRLADPDVVALQEVDKKWYDAFWVPQMRAAGFEPAGGLAEKTGLTREGCATFARRDKWRVASARVVDLKVPGPLPEERDTDAWVRTQPHLRDALSKVSTVAHICVLESVLDDDAAETKTAPGDSSTDAASTNLGGGCRRSLVVANTHLFFHPGAVHVRVMQSRWLLRHADRARRARAAEAGGAGVVGLVVCGDFNGEPHDGVMRHVADGRLSAGDSDWALGSVFRWGGTSSRAAAAELLATDSNAGASAPASDLDARQQRLGRMAASWRCVSEVERGARPSCGRDPKTGEDAAPIEVARAHARVRVYVQDVRGGGGVDAPRGRGDVPGDDARWFVAREVAGGRRRGRGRGRRGRTSRWKRSRVGAWGSYRPRGRETHPGRRRGDRRDHRGTG